MPDKYKYPTRYELEQAMAEFAQRVAVSEFLQTRGIFLMHATQEDLAEFTAGLLLEHEDLEQIRRAAFRSHSSSALSGFIVESDDETFNLVDLFERFRNQVVDQRANMRLGPPIAPKAGGGVGYRGQVEYMEYNPGRVEFLQGSARYFDYYLLPEREGKWRVMVDGSRSNDVRLVETWLSGAISRDVRLERIEEVGLSSVQSITFFDAIATAVLNSIWRLTQVKRIALRKADSPVAAHEDDDRESEPERIETDAAILSGITQAILEGDDLRRNKFVKQSETGGYRFTAMTYEYESIQHPEVLQIRVEFKRKPKVFEVAVENSWCRTGMEQSLQPWDIPPQQRIDLLSEFWCAAKRVYDDLIAEGN
jgi:hypothetical protein